MPQAKSSINRRMTKPQPEQFRSIAQRQPKQRLSQLAVIGSLLVIVLGAALAIHQKWYGFVVLVAGFAALFAATVWAIRNWEWER